MNEMKQEQIISKLDQLLSKNQANEAVVSAVKEMRASIMNQTPDVAAAAQTDAAQAES